MDYSEKIARYEEIERRGLLDKLPPEKQALWAEYKSRQQPQAEPEKSYGLGRIATADSGLTFGLGRKAGGLINAIGSYPVDRIAEAMGKENTPSFWDRYHEVVDPAVQAKEEYAKDKPVEATALELGSAIANPVNKLGVGFIGKGVGLGSKALRSAGVGAGVGSLAGAGSVENVEEVPQKVVEGAGLGGAVGGAIPLAGAGLKLGGKALKQIVGRTTGAGDVAIADAFNAGKTGNSGFLAKMRENVDAENLEKKIQSNFDKIKKARAMTYEDDITRLKQATYGKKMDIDPVVNDVKTILKEVEGTNPDLVDGEMARVVEKTKKFVKSVAKKPESQDLDGLDRLKRAIQGISTKEGTPADAVKTQLSRSVENQIVRQSPQYRKIMDTYARDSEVIDDLKKVFSLNRNSNSETVLRKLQSTARNNANTDWGYRAQLLKKIDPTGEIQREVSASALNPWTPRGLFGSGAFYGGIFKMNPALVAAASPRIAGYSAYGLGRAVSKVPNIPNISPYVAEIINN